MSSSDLARLVQRLESVTGRLEKVVVGKGTGSTPVPTSAGEILLLVNL